LIAEPPARSKYADTALSETQRIAFNKLDHFMGCFVGEGGGFIQSPHGMRTVRASGEEKTT
jgi:hypothetical protein